METKKCYDNPITPILAQVDFNIYADLTLTWMFVQQTTFLPGNPDWAIIGDQFPLFIIMCVHHGSAFIERWTLTSVHAAYPRRLRGCSTGAKNRSRNSMTAFNVPSLGQFLILAGHWP